MTLLEGEAQGLRSVAKISEVAIQGAGSCLGGVASFGSGIGDFIEPIGNVARDGRCRRQLRPRGIRNLDLAEVASLVGQRPPQRDELLGKLPDNEQFAELKMQLRDDLSWIGAKSTP